MNTKKPAKQQKNEKQEDLSNLYVDNPYLIIVRKKIRNLKKKQKNIVEIEKKLKEKKELNQDQVKALESKTEVESRLKEWLKIEAEMVAVAKQIETTSTRPAVQEQEIVPTESEPAPVVPLVDPKLETIVALLHVSTYYNDSEKKGVIHRTEFLDLQKERLEQGASIIVKQLTDFDQVQDFVNKALFLYDENLRNDVIRTIGEVQKIVDNSEERVLESATYSEIGSTLREILQVQEILNERKNSQFTPDQDNVLPPSHDEFEGEPAQGEQDDNKPRGPRGPRTRNNNNNNNRRFSSGNNNNRGRGDRAPRGNGPRGGGDRGGFKRRGSGGQYQQKGQGQGQPQQNRNPAPNAQE